MITESAADEVTGSARSLDAVWPAVSRRLTVQLRRRGLSTSDAEDLVQECAVRVLTSGVSWQDEEDLLRWCNTVTRNLHVDLLRRPRPAPIDDHSLLELPTSQDVHRSVNARLLLEELRSAWPRLSHRDREVLTDAALGYPAPHADRKAAVRVNVARHRARQRLGTMLQGALGLSALAAAVRRAGRVTVPTATLLSSALVALALGEAHVGSTETRQPRSVVLVTPGTISAHLPTGRPAGQLAPSPTVAAPTRARVTVSRGSSPPPVQVVLPTGDGVALGHHPRTPGEPLLCLWDLPVVGDACAPAGGVVPASVVRR